MAVQAQFYPENMGLPLPMCGLQDWMVNTAPAVPSFEADFFFSLQDPSMQTVPFHVQQNAQNLASAAASSSSTCDSFLPMSLSQSLDAQLEMQRQELDCILQLQNERLRSALLEQRKRQLAILLKGMETKALYSMERKEEDLARATKKTMELEACLRKAEMEVDAWRRLAKANEVMVIDLNNTLEQVRESLVWVSNTAEDAESLFCGSCDTEQGEVKEESSNKKMACKHCNSRNSCVLFLPCRHLCSCKSCEAFLDACPVCESVKEASMKVFWV
ncbi:probable BOI-related E3 ubiquitin-protein ligase 2 [Durio zibethinus]|uniref:Probable BOI-related E3 ubiquitin-protein ligase 2 n=1 Tax=Durio zibethinus TaxID=66656 RepID=A0A6P6ANT4_DURZI|nr:probable BOI-related E3 ubiquitin-protein ligase 2 [Durio zibethinus]